MAVAQPIPTTVAIVGAGVAGLTLALSLEQAQIPFILLESRKEIAPAVGASIGLLPTGLLILDQLGIYKHIQRITVPCTRSFHRDGSGKVILEHSAFGLFDSVLGYDMVLMERQKLLEFLYNRIQDKSRVLTNARVTNIQEHADSVTIRTSTEQVYVAKLVVGSDGVHSVVRAHIAATGDSLGQLAPSLNHGLSARYTCVYGISSTIRGLLPGAVHFLLREQHNFIVFTGPDSVAYWFVFEDMGKDLFEDQIPKFTAADAENLCLKYLDSPVTETVSFGDIYRNHTAKTMSALQEGISVRWHTSRLVLAGDSAHKMTPNSAMGGNLAIESAACLANCILRSRNLGLERGHDDLEDLPQILEEYQQMRFQRACKARDGAKGLTRAQFLPTIWAKFAVRFLLPRRTTQAMLKLLVKPLDGGVKIDFLDMPRRALLRPESSLLSERKPLAHVNRPMYAFLTLPVVFLGASVLWKLYGM